MSQCFQQIALLMFSQQVNFSINDTTVDLSGNTHYIVIKYVM